MQKEAGSGRALAPYLLELFDIASARARRRKRLTERKTKPIDRC
jgi:hypothetical protein